MPGSYGPRIKAGEAEFPGASTPIAGVEGELGRFGEVVIAEELRWEELRVSNGFDWLRMVPDGFDMVRNNTIFQL